MKSTPHKPVFKKETGNIAVVLVFVVILMFGLMLTGGLMSSNKPPQQPVSNVIPATVIASNQKSLQLIPLNFVTVTPIPTVPDQEACGISGGSIETPGQTATGECCVEDGGANNASQCCLPDEYYQQAIAGNTAGWCDAKPVIYLYPEKDTTVTVQLTIPGTVIISNPKYPQTGWQNILAHPNGKFEYQGKNYHELFYETNEVKALAPIRGFIVPQKSLKSFLSDLTLKLGLLPSERQEFLTYWIPKLNGLNKPYVFISIFPPEEKDYLDHVDFTPKPDTFINFILYYKGLDQQVKVEPFLLPKFPPQRVGFTAVEWGGIIDH